MTDNITVDDTVERTELIDAICAKPFNQGPATVLTKHGFMRENPEVSTGDAPHWEWVRDVLEQQTIERLRRLRAACQRGWLLMGDFAR